MVEKDGFGPYMADSSGYYETLPADFTVTLKPAQKLGGRVVDDQSNPVAGAEVELSIPFETGLNIPLRSILVHLVKTTTDADGRWTLYQYPASYTKLDQGCLSVAKGGFLGLAKVPTLSELTADDAGNFNAILPLTKGYVLEGRVTADGQPLKGAMLRYGRSLYSVGEQGTTSDEQGTFRFENLPLGEKFPLFVTAPENATDLISPELPKAMRMNRDQESVAMYQKRLAEWKETTDEGKAYCERLDRNRSVLSSWRIMLVDADGNFRFDDLASGNWSVLVSPCDHCGFDFDAKKPHYRGEFTIQDKTIDLGTWVLTIPPTAP